MATPSAPINATTNATAKGTVVFVQGEAFLVETEGTPRVQAEIAELAWIPLQAPHGVKLAPLSERHILPAALRMRRSPTISPIPFPCLRQPFCFPCPSFPICRGRRRSSAWSRFSRPVFSCSRSC